MGRYGEIAANARRIAMEAAYHQLRPVSFDSALELVEAIRAREEVGALAIRLKEARRFRPEDRLIRARIAGVGQASNDLDFAISFYAAASKPILPTVEKVAA